MMRSEPAIPCTLYCIRHPEDGRLVYVAAPTLSMAVNAAGDNWGLSKGTVFEAIMIAGSEGRFPLLFYDQATIPKIETSVN